MANKINKINKINKKPLLFFSLVLVLSLPLILSRCASAQLEKSTFSKSNTSDILPISHYPKKTYIKYLSQKKILLPSAIQPHQSKQILKINGLVNILETDPNTKKIILNQTANFIWQQKSLTNIQLDLFGPLGIDPTHLAITPNQAELITAQGKTYTADNPEDLMQETLGWQLPILGLQYWLLGIPDFNTHNPPIVLLNTQGLIKTLGQYNWHITYLTYQKTESVSVVKPNALSPLFFIFPKKIILTHPPIRVIVLLSQVSIAIN